MLAHQDPYFLFSSFVLGNMREFWTFKDWVVQIPAPSGQNGVQVPYHIVGFVCQMPFLKNKCERFADKQNVF